MYGDDYLWRGGVKTNLKGVGLVGNLFWGNHLDYFCIKFRSIDAQVLSHSFHTKIIQSTTAITSIAIRLANRLRIKQKNQIKILIKSFCYFWLLPKVESHHLVIARANRRFARSNPNLKNFR